MSAFDPKQTLAKPSYAYRLACYDQRVIGETLNMRIVVSGFSRTFLLVWLVIISAIVLYAVHEDLTSEGLERAQLFRAIGYAIYPLFYGASMFCLWKLGKFYGQANTFLTVDGSHLFVWSKEIPLREISSVSIKRGSFFSRWLMIAQKNGINTKINSIALNNSVDDVADRIRAAVGLSNASNG